MTYQTLFLEDNTFPNIKLAASIKCPKAKSVSASGGALPPGPLTRGFAPKPRHVFLLHNN